MAEPDYTPEQIQTAYHAAAQARDTEAMDQLHGMLTKAYQKETPSPVSDSSLENFAAGMGHGAVRMGRGVGNIVGLGRVFPNALGDKAIQESDVRDKPLLETGAGAAGDIVGQIAATAPMGMGTGALLKGTAGTGKVLLNALRAGTAGGENALQSAAMADPEHQGEAALEGAAVGAGLSKAGQVGGRLLRGTVEKTPAAERLIEEAKLHDKDLFIPISQGAKPTGISGAAKATYQSAFPYALGVEGRLERQSKAAADTMRGTLTESGAPIVSHQRIPVGTAQTQEQATANLKQLFDKEYEDKLKSYSFNTPSDFRDQVAASIRKEHPNLPDTQVETIANTIDSRAQEYSKKGTLTGGNLLEARAAARDDLENLGKQNKLRNPAANETGLGSFEDIIDNEINSNRGIASNTKAPASQQKAAQQTVEDLLNYKRLGEQYKEALPVIEGTKKAGLNRGEFTAGQAMPAAAEDTHARRTLQDIHEVLEKENPGAVNPAGRHILHTMGGVGLPLAAASMGHPLVAAGAVGVPHLMVSKPVQKFMYGDTGWQQALARAIRSNPQLAYSTGLVARSAVNAP